MQPNIHFHFQLQRLAVLPLLDARSATPCEASTAQSYCTLSLSQTVNAYIFSEFDPFIMSLQRPLRGHCACRRNQYYIRAPQGVKEVAQVLFSTGESHSMLKIPTFMSKNLHADIDSTGIAQANPLSAHIRIPLTWYHSATFAEFPDETPTSIRRVYENPLERHTRRTFCGVCGTPLTYWSEHPRTEADYIQVTMGSLSRDDLGDLEDLGLIPESPIEAPQFEVPAIAGGRAAGTGDATSDAVAAGSTALHPSGTQRETTGIPWFDSIIEGSSLGGRLRTTRGTRQSADGLTRFEIEITEFNDDGTELSDSSGNNGKRKLGDRTDVDEMEGVSH